MNNQEASRPQTKRPGRWKPAIVLGALLILVLVSARTSLMEQWQHFTAASLGSPAVFTPIDVDEPSGIVHHPTRNTLLVISDRGILVEMDLSLRVLKRHWIGGDLEAVAIHPERGTVFALSERDWAVIEYDLDAGSVTRTMLIDYWTYPDLVAKGYDNLGPEGICFVPNENEQGYRLLAVVQAQPARLIELAYPPAPLSEEAISSLDLPPPPAGPYEKLRIVKMIDVGLSGLSEVIYDPRCAGLILLSSSARVAAVCTPDGTGRMRFRLPGKKPEGLVFLDNGEMLVTQDTGGLWRVRGELAALRRNLHLEN